MTVTQHDDDLQVAIRELIQADDSGDHHLELEAAANFALQHGPLGDLFEGVELHRAQAARRHPAAWGILAHWSIERGDPADGPVSGLDCADCMFLEQVLALPIRTESCEACGGGLTGHAVLHLQYEARVFCLGGWERDDPASFWAGTGLCAEQIGDAYAARWAAPLVDGNWAVITRTYLRVDYGGGVEIERHDFYQVARNPNDPSNSQIGATMFRTEEVDSGDPAGEDLDQIAAASFEPEPGEWVSYMPCAPALCGRPS